MAQNSLDANSKPEEVPKNMRVRMCARSMTTKPVHTATNSRQEKVPKRLRVRTRARSIATQPVPWQRLGSPENTTPAHVRALNRHAEATPGQQKKAPKSQITNGAARSVRGRAAGDPRAVRGRSAVGFGSGRILARFARLRARYKFAKAPHGRPTFGSKARKWARDAGATSG